MLKQYQINRCCPCGYADVEDVQLINYLLDQSQLMRTFLQTWAQLTNFETVETSSSDSSNIRLKNQNFNLNKDWQYENSEQGGINRSFLYFAGCDIFARIAEITVHMGIVFKNF